MYFNRGVLSPTPLPHQNFLSNANTGEQAKAYADDTELNDDPHGYYVISEVFQDYVLIFYEIDSHDLDLLRMQG
jgi:hypothetical protein